MSYDTMSVCELAREIVREEKLAYQIGVTGDDWISLKELDSAIRHRVIRDASVGTLTKTKRQKGQMEWKTNENENYHAGVYDVIPREVK